MGSLVVYFSFEGNIKLVAEKIAETLHADCVALKTVKEFPAEGFKKYFWGGKSVMFGEKPQLLNDPIDFSRYETVIIGTPVWAGSFTPPIKTLVSQYKIEGKRLALFASSGGGGAKKCFMKLKAALPGNEVIGETEFVEPKKNPEDSLQKAAAWASSLKL